VETGDSLSSHTQPGQPPFHFRPKPPFSVPLNAPIPLDASTAAGSDFPFLPKIPARRRAFRRRCTCATPAFATPPSRRRGVLAMLRCRPLFARSRGQVFRLGPGLPADGFSFGTAQIFFWDSSGCPYCPPNRLWTPQPSVCPSFRQAPSDFGCSRDGY
jgi:hypothetical protein